MLNCASILRRDVGFGWSIHESRQNATKKPRCTKGFTLVEMMVSMAVLIVILLLMLSIIQTTASALKKTNGKIEGFRDARVVFDAMTRTIGQATLNTYYDYSPSPPAPPVKYVRKSDLHFISGQATTLLKDLPTIPYPLGHSIFFQAPLDIAEKNNYQGMDNLLNACGYFLQYGLDSSKPSFLASLTGDRYRYRLMEFCQPSENLSIYDSATAASGSTAWFRNSLSMKNQKCVSQLAENIVVLVILPQLSRGDTPSAGVSLAPKYEYDSRDSSSICLNQLPPMVKVLMVAIDEASAIKLGNTQTPPNLTAGASFDDSTKLEADLDVVKKNLSAAAGNIAGNHIPLRYQVFLSEVPIQNAKWSK